MKTQATPKIEIVKHNGKTEVAIIKGPLIAEMFDGQEHQAELIVKAVNRDHLFEELVEALKIAHEYCSRSACLREDDERADKFNDLLKRAKGEL